MDNKEADPSVALNTALQENPIQLTVLLAEDNPMNQRIIQSIVNRLILFPVISFRCRLMGLIGRDMCVR